MATDKIKVAVRVRPFNRREVELKTKCVVEMTETQTILHHNDSKSEGEGRKQPKTFAFDRCFFSFDVSHPLFAGQEQVYNDLGEDILDNAFLGYNACIFAYGQTGSGKSFSMMGSSGNEGIIPRLCNALFDRIAKNADSSLVYKVEVSYMEIYNEKVHDLLDPKGTKQNLRVREHNILGPYVDGLSLLAVSKFEDIDNLMQEGNKSRTVAATNMNNESSRSHAVFSIILTCSITDTQSGVSGEKVSKMSLVDLAGSERAVKTGAVGDRLKEGSNINKSLTTLGLVISKLADQSSGRAKDKFVPYRDSVLTWLLKDNLGGNSRTVMIATISPAGDNYEETLSTLRYADRAKRIVNHAVVNEDPNARIIRELRAEVEELRVQLNKTKGQDTVEKLEETERLMIEMSQTWEEKLHKTERIHQERQQALEKMGISVQASGIKVEKYKCYLVNLNADPSMNELLVYYLKERTLIGRPDAPVEQDIQLNGLGIMPEHCIIEMANNTVHVTPLDGARTCVNGSVVTTKTQLRHGDRVLWGNNHFFRVNCPKSITSPVSSEEQLSRPIDYEFAREELMLKEMSNDPIQSAMTSLEKQHEEDKQGALEQQRRMYEKQLQMLRNQMSPTTPYAPYGLYDPLGFRTPTGFPPSANMQSKVDSWSQDRDELFRVSLAKLREDVVKANSLVREANSLAEEVGKRTEFHVTLQIPAANLSPNRKKSAFVSEPAILVKRENNGNQVWSMEKLENKLIDMREFYAEHKDLHVSESQQKLLDPFYESQENHNLIGVANVFLEVLFHDVKLDYHIPIISQQGEVAGRLHVEISRIAGNVCDRMNETSSDSSSGSNVDISDRTGDCPPSQIICQVHIKAATGLPPSLSNFVFCQYYFWGYSEPIVVAPIVNTEYPLTCKGKDSTAFKFDHVKDFAVTMTEEFIEHCSEGALSIEVWGHRSTGFGSTKSSWEIESQMFRSKSLSDRWSELTRKIELWTEVQELNEQGEYSPVEILVRLDNYTGGIYQLRQGQQRRIQVNVKPVLNSGTLPIIVESISSIAIGSICSRSKLQKGLDSYQEEDLTMLREKWSEALMKRREYLDEHIQKIIKKPDKTEQDVEREKSLIDQWVNLTEERNAVLVPAANSGIPGSPADWDPLPGMEKHTPVLFLDLNADDMSTPNIGEGLKAVGANSILPKEHGGKLFNLPIIKVLEKDVGAVASWDSSIHDSVYLNRVTQPNERIYLILKVVVRLSHPATMELVLRKRLSTNVYKKQSFTNMIKKRMSRMDCPIACGITYEVVSNIPKAFEDVEDRESLALMAASGEDTGTFDGETYIEKYTRGVSAVESILTLDKLRQEVALKELLAAQGRPLRKTASVPNISHGFVWADLSASSSNLLDETYRSDSVCDLHSASSFENLDKIRRRTLQLLDSSVQPPKDGAKPFGIARPTFLNLNLNMNLRNPTSKTCISPQLSKLVKPMTTVVEENNDHKEVKPLLNMTNGDDDDKVDVSSIDDSIDERDDAEDEDEFAEFESYESQHAKSMNLNQPGNEVEISHSDVDDKTQTVLTTTTTTCSNVIIHQHHNNVIVNDSDVQTKSMSSSGYSSHALSSTTLSSEDSLSMKSISVDETPEENKNNGGGGGGGDQVRCTESTESALVDFVSTLQPGEMIVNDNVSFSDISKSINDLSGIEDVSLATLHISEEDLSTCCDNVRCQNEEMNYCDLRRSESLINDKSSFREEREQTPKINEPAENESIVDVDAADDLNDDDEDDADNVDNFELSQDELNSLPSWITIGECVTTRPANKNGVISYIGRTGFAKGTWIGVELDVPMGKNDGSVNGIRYFQCKPRYGVFVKPDKLLLDKRGRLLRDKSTLSRSKGEGLNNTGLTKAKSRSDVRTSKGANNEQLNNSLRRSKK